MKDEIRLRVLSTAEYILRSGSTVRACAARSGVSKTTVHKDIRVRLPQLDSALSEGVNGVLERNLRERHLRGGEATREKYRRMREQRKN